MLRWEFQIVYLISAYLVDRELMNLLVSCRRLYTLRPRLIYSGQYPAKLVENRGIPITNFTNLHTRESPLRYPVYELRAGILQHSEYLRYVRTMTLDWLYITTTIVIPADWALQELSVAARYGISYSLNIGRNLHSLSVDDSLMRINCKKISHLSVYHGRLRMFSGMHFDSVSVKSSRNSQASYFISADKVYLHLANAPDVVIRTTATYLGIYMDPEQAHVIAAPVTLDVEDIHDVRGLDYSRLRKLITFMKAPEFSIPSLEKITFCGYSPNAFSHYHNPQLKQVKLQRRGDNDLYHYPARRLKYLNGTVVHISDWQRWCIEHLPLSLLPLIMDKEWRAMRWVNAIVIAVFLLDYLHRYLQGPLIVLLILNILPILVE